MKTDQLRNRLIEVFLREQVGGLKPPDLSGRILARALGDQARQGLPEPAVRPVIRRRWETFAAVAATLLIALLVWYMASLPEHGGSKAPLPGYPGPRT